MTVHKVSADPMAAIYAHGEGDRILVEIGYSEGGATVKRLLIELDKAQAADLNQKIGRLVSGGT